MTALELPGGPGVRVDTALAAGDVIPPFYDSMVAKLCVWAPDREAALARGRRALAEYGVEGVPTTIPLHIAVLDSTEFRAGKYDTRALPGWKSVAHPRS